MEELSEKEKDYLLTILYKQDWTETEICDSIIRKLELNKIQSQNNKTEKICPIIQLIRLTQEKIERDKWQIDKRMI